MPFILFIVAVIALGVVTIKLKRKNRKTMHDAWEQLGEKILKDDQQQASQPVHPPVQPMQQTQPAAKPEDINLEEIYVRQPVQDLATLAVPDGLPFAEEIRVLKYMAEKYPDRIVADLYSPAGEITISLFEQRMGIRLPDDLRALYAFTNGMDLCGMDLSFESLQTIEGMYRQGYCYFKEDGDQEHYLVIGSMIGDGISIILDKRTGDLLRYDEGKTTNYRDVVTLLKWLIGFEYEGYINNDDPYITAYLKNQHS